MQICVMCVCNHFTKHVRTQFSVTWVQQYATCALLHLLVTTVLLTRQSVLYTEHMRCLACCNMRRRLLAASRLLTNAARFFPLHTWNVLPAAARWKGALVAVKVIEHGRQDSSSAVDIARESSLATSVVHPNVVSSSGSCITCAATRLSSAIFWCMKKLSFIHGVSIPYWSVLLQQGGVLLACGA